AVDLGGVVDDLVDGQQREVDRHDLDDRAQAEHGGSDGRADEALLGDRGVPDPLGAEFFEETLGDLVGALEDTDLLAHDEDVLVAEHLGAQCVPQSLAVSDHRHVFVLSPTPRTPGRRAYAATRWAPGWRTCSRRASKHPGAGCSPRSRLLPRRSP